MPEYGLTPQGVEIKRLDTIADEIHTALSDAWGVNTRQDPQSFINVLVTNYADQIADLWEFGQQLYYAMYPSTAEGVDLDNAAQYGGTTREQPAKSYYRILCTGADGTVLPAGTMIASDTNPRTNLTIEEPAEITRQSFNKAAIIATTTELSSALSVAIDSELYTCEPDPKAELKDNMKKLADQIIKDDIKVSLSGTTLILEGTSVIENHVLVLSENLTTETVGSVITFGTEEYGDIFIPPGVITQIVRAVSGLKSVVNVGSYIAGRLVETDEELRQSYADKIFNRSTNMIESIRSAILKLVQGVTSCSVYENYGNVVDEKGRYPHSVEVVADGGDEAEIAQVIWDTKAAGINTYGDTVVEIVGLYGEQIPVRFNRPKPVYIWFHCGITRSKTTNLPTNYVELIKEQITASVKLLGAGDDVIPQKFLPEVPGVDYLDIKLYATSSEGEGKPAEYPDRAHTIDEREIARTTESRIEVELDG